MTLWVEPAIQTYNHARDHSFNQTNQLLYWRHSSRYQKEYQRAEWQSFLSERVLQSSRTTTSGPSLKGGIMIVWIFLGFHGDADMVEPSEPKVSILIFIQFYKIITYQT